MLAIAVASLLWLLARWFFCDESDIPWWLVAVTIVYVWLSLVPDDAGLRLIPQPELAQFVFTLSPQMVSW